MPDKLPPSFPPSDHSHSSKTSDFRTKIPDQMPPAYLPRKHPSDYSHSSPANSVNSLQPGHTTQFRNDQIPAPFPQQNYIYAQQQVLPQQPSFKRRKRPRIFRRIFMTLVVLVVLILGWSVFLYFDCSKNLARTEALSDIKDTPGTTYLLVGTDSREDGAVQDGTQGARADSILLLHTATNGRTALISIPRDTFINIPGYGSDKINAAYAYGGSALLTHTVEKLSGLKIDHYVEIGMGGVTSVVDAVGGVELCSDLSVDDFRSELKWEPGCHTVNGKTALAFARMRYQDPRGDIGRAERQRQVISKTVSEALSPVTFINPIKTLDVERAGSRAFTVDSGTSPLDIARLVLDFRSASKSGMTGTPPIESLNYTTPNGASAVLLQDTTAPIFFAKLRDGSFQKSDLQQ